MWGFLRSSLSWWGLSRGLEMYKYVWYHLSPSGKFVVLESSFCLPGCLPPVTSVSGEGGGLWGDGWGPGTGSGSGNPVGAVG